MAKANIWQGNVEQQQTNGVTPYQKNPRGPPTDPKARQGEFPSSGKLNITALKTDIVRPDNKAEANSIDNLNNLNGAKPD